MQHGWGGVLIAESTKKVHRQSIDFAIFTDPPLHIHLKSFPFTGNLLTTKLQTSRGLKMLTAVKSYDVNITNLLREKSKFLNELKTSCRCA